MKPDATTLEAAARWYVQLQATDASPADRDGWQCWLAANPSHRAAWERVQQLEQRLHDLPARIALPTLRGADAGRRAALRALVVLLGAGPLAWTASRTRTAQRALADVATATGERRELHLDDGSLVHLNTATALDIAYDAQQRRLRLRHGEILVKTASDLLARPFVVDTAQGRIRALGTRFSVRADSDAVRVAVLEHAVELQPRDSARVLRLEAGEQARFDASGIGFAESLNANAEAWTRGALIALDWRLDDFITELARHRRGYLGCDPAVSHLRVSGAFRLDDTDAALDNLAATLPLRLHRVSGYWVRVVTREG